MAAQACLREKCTRKVDTKKRGEVYCHQHRDGVNDTIGAAKSASLSGIRPQKVEREKIEHDDPEFGGVDQTVEPEEVVLEGEVIETPEQLAEAQAKEAAELKRIEALVAEMGALQGPVQLYEKFKKRQDAIKADLRESLGEGAFEIAGVEFEVGIKEVFDAKLATAAAATVDEDGNKIVPVLTKGELEKISVMTPNAAKANAEFKNRPEVLKKLKKEQRNLTIKSVKTTA